MAGLGRSRAALFVQSTPVFATAQACDTLAVGSFAASLAVHRGYGRLWRL